MSGRASSAAYQAIEEDAVAAERRLEELGKTLRAIAHFTRERQSDAEATAQLGLWLVDRPRDRWRQRHVTPSARPRPHGASECHGGDGSQGGGKEIQPLERVRVLTKCRLIPDQSRPASGGPDQVDARRSRRTLAIASPQVGELGVESNDESSAFGFDAVGVTTLLILAEGGHERDECDDRSGNPPRPVPATRTADHEIDAWHGRNQQHECGGNSGLSTTRRFQLGWRAECDAERQDGSCQCRVKQDRAHPP